MVVTLISLDGQSKISAPHTLGLGSEAIMQVGA